MLRLHYPLWLADAANGTQQKTNIINKLQEEVDVLKRKRDDLHSEESASTKGREESDERDAKLARLEEVKAKNAELKAELKKYIEFDPELIEDMGSCSTSLPALQLSVGWSNAASVWLRRERHCRSAGRRQQVDGQHPHAAQVVLGEVRHRGGGLQLQLLRPGRPRLRGVRGPRPRPTRRKTTFFRVPSPLFVSVHKSLVPMR